METRVKIDISRSLPTIRRHVNSLVSDKVADVTKGVIDAYLEELTESIGGIPGGSTHMENGAVWAPLSEQSLEEEGTFWKDSGELKQSLVLRIDETDGKTVMELKIVDREVYDRFLWNELGFTSKSGKFVRRPLFLPLADKHFGELQEVIRKQLGKIQVKLEVHAK